MVALQIYNNLNITTFEPIPYTHTHSKLPYSCCRMAQH